MLLSGSLRDWPLYRSIISWRKRYSGIIRFLLLFSLYVTVAFLAIHIVRTRTDILSLLSMKTAQLSSWLLNVIGVRAQTVSSIVYQSQGFAIDISYKCTGILLMAFFAAGTFAYPCSSLKKLSGLIVGIPLIFLINLVRLIGLFLIGTFAMPLFYFSHKVLAEILMILTAFLIWWFWLKRVSLKGG
jgi:exosortase/archaeosortase family protein